MMATIEALADTLRDAGSNTEKLEILKKIPEVGDFSHPITKYINKAPIEEQIVLLSIIAIGEGPIVFRGYKDGASLKPLLHVLLELERFYEGIGGIVGYHNTILKLINGMNPSFIDASTRLSEPKPIDITSFDENVREEVRWGIEHLEEMGEIYPVGGAGDRLNLKDPSTGQPLPAASLCFCGRTLLEGLIHDLQAKEYLYFKLTGKKVLTPVALMTSEEKDNDRLVKEMLKKNNWFGRPEESFKIFTQPLVPVITIEGHWSMAEPLIPTLKPGGHGVIWKMAEEEGVFDWFFQQNRSKALVRQINNPIAAIDYGILAFIGFGLHHDKAFGVMSCPRLLNAAEGALVIAEKDNKCSLSNIEYTNFNGLDFKYSLANTNVLFVDLHVIQEALKKCLIPGMLINFKHKSSYYDSEGNFSEVFAGRLESTMQNISDCIAADKSYITFNERIKTISPLKTTSESQAVFKDIQSNGRDLLENYCGFKVSEDAIFLYHPILGPLYTIIGQKLKGGNIGPKSELRLDIAELLIENLNLNGNLSIVGDGKCVLKNVTIKNKVSIQGSGEFFAEDITFTGSHEIEVPKGLRITASNQNGEIVYSKEKISQPTWEWKYSFDSKNNVRISYEHRSN